MPGPPQSLDSIARIQESRRHGVPVAHLLRVEVVIPDDVGGGVALEGLRGGEEEVDGLVLEEVLVVPHGLVHDTGPRDCEERTGR